MSIRGRSVALLVLTASLVSCGDDTAAREGRPVHEAPPPRDPPEPSSASGSGGRARQRVQVPERALASQSAPDRPSAPQPVPPPQTDAERLASNETTFDQRDKMLKDAVRKGGAPALDRLLGEWSEAETDRATRASIRFGRFACAFAREDQAAASQRLVEFVRSVGDLLADGTFAVPPGHARLAALTGWALVPASVKAQKNPEEAPGGLGYWRAMGVLDWGNHDFVPLLSFALGLAESGDAASDVRIAASVLAHAIVYSTRARFPGEAMPGDALLASRYVADGIGARTSREYFRNVERGIQAAQAAGDGSFATRELSMRRALERGVPREDAAVVWSLVETVRALQPLDDSARALAEQAEWLAGYAEDEPGVAK